MTALADITAAEVGELLGLLTRMYGCDLAPARARLESFARSLFDCGLDELSIEQAGEIRRHIKAGTIRTPIDDFDAAPVSAAPPTERTPTMPRKHKGLSIDAIDEQLDQEHAAINDRREQMGLPPIASTSLLEESRRISDEIDVDRDRGRKNGHGKKPLADMTDTELTIAHGLPNAAAVTAGREEMIAVDAIVNSPFNPRKDFDEAKLQELSESLRRDGLLQNLTVRVHPTLKGAFELIAGERRWRAAQLAGLREVRCRVIEADDARAIELVGIENYERADFNAIEEAQWFKQMIEGAGYTQEALAARLKLSQGQISNRLRLLELPEEWRQRIISREIPPTHAREISRWAKYPRVLARLEEEIKFNGIGNLESFSDEVRSAANAESRPLKGRFGFRSDAGWRGGEVRLKPSPDELERLQIEKVGDGKRGEERAFNIKLWQELQDAAEAKAKAREQKKLDAGGKSTGTKAGVEAAPLTAAEKRERARKAAEQAEKRLKVDLLRWYQARIVECLDAGIFDYIAARLFVFVAAQNEAGAPDKIEAAVTAAGGRPVKRKRHEYGGASLDLWPSLATISDAGGVLPYWLSMIRQWATRPLRDWELSEDLRDFAAVAGCCGVSLARDFDGQNAGEFLARRTREELDDLCREWKIPVPHPSANRKACIAHMRSCDRPKPAPKCLLAIEPKCEAPAPGKSPASGGGKKKGGA